MTFYHACPATGTKRPVSPASRRIASGAFAIRRACLALLRHGVAQSALSDRSLRELPMAPHRHHALRTNHPGFAGILSVAVQQDALEVVRADLPHDDLPQYPGE